MTWPLLLDYTRDDCKRLLRKLELEAYASMVTAFRAQGDLTKEKKKILQDLSSMLSISLERHRAEIRRAVNDEKLNTIADRMVGPNTEMEWATEGRRLVPLMPRLVPQTAFTALANNLANIQAARNAAMPEPSATGVKIDPLINEDLIQQPKSRKRSLSIDSPTSPSKVPFIISPTLTPAQLPSPVPTPLLSPPIMAPVSPQAPIPPLSLSIPSIPSANITSSTPSSFAHGSTMTPQIVPSTGKPPIRGNQQRTIAPAGSSSGHPPGKQVILVSGSAGTIPPSILQRCLSVPMAKAMNSAVTTPSGSVPTVLIGKNTVTNTRAVNPITISTPVSIHGSLGPVVSGNMVVYTTTRARPSKTNPGARQPVMRPRGSGLMPSPLHAQPTQPAGMMGMNTALQFPTLIGGQNKGGPTMIRGSMPTGSPKGTRGPSNASVRMETSSVVLKPVTQGSSSHSTRILPKPLTKSSLSSGNVIMTPSNSTSPQIMVVGGTTTSKTSAPGGTGTPRIVNVMSVTPAPVRQPPTNTYSSIGSKANRLAKAASSASSAGAKPNVIVVHKAHAWPQAQQQQIKMIHHPSIPTGSKVQIIKKSESKPIPSPVKSKLSGNEEPLKHPINTALPISTSITELDPTQLDPKNTILADIIQATGISSDGSLHQQQALTAGTIKKIQTMDSTIPSLSPLLSSPTSTSADSSISSPVKKKPTTLLSPSSTNLGMQAVSAVIAQESDAKASVVELVTVTESSEIHLQKIGRVESTISEISDCSASDQVAVEESKQPEIESAIESDMTFHNIPLMDQLHEGQVLEIQAPDAANLLNSSGQLSKEVLDLLQQVGIQLNQDQVTLDTSSSLNETDVQLELPGQGEVDNISVEGEVQLDPVTGMLYLQPSQKGSEPLQETEVLDTLNAETVNLSEIRIIDRSDKSQDYSIENLNSGNKLILESDSPTVINVSSVLDTLSEDPFQNLAVGECVTVTIDGGGEGLGSSVEIGSEMETVISGDCIDGELITESMEVDLEESECVSETKNL